VHAPAHFRVLAAAAALDQRQSGRASHQDGSRGDLTVTPASVDRGPVQRVWHQIWCEMLDRDAVTGGGPGPHRCG